MASNGSSEQLIGGKESTTTAEENDESSLRKASRGVIASLAREPVALWVLFLTTLGFANNQLNRYVLGSVANKLETGVGFGSGDGQSVGYGFLTGPITTFPYCAGIVLFGAIGDRVNKVYLFVFLMFGWSGFSALMAAANEYWELGVFRGLSSFFSSPCVAVGSGIVADYFPAKTLGTALGIYGWGVPIGQGLVLGMGDAVTDVAGYRIALIACAVWAVPIAFLILFTVKERKGGTTADGEAAELIEKQEQKKPMGIFEACREILISPTLVCLYIAGAFRQSAALNWVYFRIQFYENIHGMTKTEIASYMAWIPIVAGVSGGFFFGWVSDKLSSRGAGALGRLQVIAALHCLQIPTIFGILFTPIYGNFAIVFIEEFFERYFVPGVSAALVTICRPEMRVQAIAYYFFVNTLTGGNATLLAPIISKAFENHGVSSDESLRYALYVLYLGLMSGAALFYTLAMLFWRWDPHKKRLERSAEHVDFDFDPEKAQSESKELRRKSTVQDA